MSAVHHASILDALSRRAFCVTTERQLQDAVASVLVEHGLDVKREVYLEDASRIDLLVGDIGIELKIDGSNTALIRQLDRYAHHPRIGSLILVTTRRRHRDIVAINFGVPFSVHVVG